MQSDDSVKLPLDLVIVALLFVFDGTLHLVGMLAGLLLDSFILDLSFIEVFVGVGLLRLRPGWRTVALILIMLGIIVLPVVFVFYLFSDWPAALKLHGRYVMDIPRAAALGSTLAGFSLCLWQYRVLTRRPVRTLFSARTVEQTGLRRGTKVSLALVAGLALLMNVASLYVYKRVDPQNPRRSTSTEPNGQVMWDVAYGYRWGKLAYVVFHGEEGNRISSIVSSSSAGEAWLDKPDGSTLRLPSEHQLHECINGVYRASDARVTREQFEAFMRSDPEEYSIDALLSFVSASPTQGSHRTH